MLLHFLLIFDNIWFDDNVVVPIPPLEIGEIPGAALLTFKSVILAPEPDKLVAVRLVADIIVPVATLFNVPPLVVIKLTKLMLMLFHFCIYPDKKYFLKNICFIIISWIC